MIEPLASLFFHFGIAFRGHVCVLGGSSYSQHMGKWIYGLFDYIYISFGFRLFFCFLLKLMGIVRFEWIYTKSCLYCIYKSTATPNMNDKSSIYAHFTYLLITTIQSIFKLKIAEFLASKISTSPNQFKSYSFNFV